MTVNPGGLRRRGTQKIVSGASNLLGTAPRSLALPTMLASEVAS